MKSTININKIILQLKQYFLENQDKELMYWGIMALIFTLIHQEGSFLFILSISGLIFAARQFKAFGHTPSGIHFLMIPATQAEKIITAVLLNTVYYFIMSVVTYTIGNLLGSTLFNNMMSTQAEISWSLFTGEQHTIWSVLISFISTQAIYMLGSLIFIKHPVRKTILSIIAITVTLYIIEYFIFQIVFGNETKLADLLPFFTEKFANPDDSFYKIITLLIQGVFAIILWVVSYFRLAEKEV
jgi:hypothetical protein